MLACYCDEPGRFSFAIAGYWGATRQYSMSCSISTDRRSVQFSSNVYGEMLHRNKWTQLEGRSTESNIMTDLRNFFQSTTIEWIAIKELSAASRQARRHSPSKIRNLSRSISETGFFNPILVDETNGIIAGHARLDAAKRLGMPEVPTISLPGLSADQKKALRIADNRLAEDATWNDELLALELSDLVAADFDLELTGFDTIDIDRILEPKNNTVFEDDPLPSLPEHPVSRIGDIWKCGEHLVACGDARDETVYQELLAGQQVDMVFTDVPYNVAVPGNVSGLGKVKHDNFAMASGEMSDDEFRAFLHDCMKLARDHSREGSLHYQFIDWRHIADMVNVGEELFSSLMNICVWAKSNGGMGSFYRSQHEMVAVFKHGDAPHVNNVQLGRMGRYRSNLWQYPGGSSFSATRKTDLADHPTIKPIEMVADAIRDATTPGNRVLDPFGGSGTTMLAAEATNRRATLIEIDPKYVDVILSRFHRSTSKEPILLPEGKSFTTVKAEREEISHD